jgi:pyruvate dehydrogenase E2 component (dihydrolipoamide acetyltransferase)
VEREDTSRGISCARLTIDCAVGALAGLRPEHQDGQSEGGFILPAATSPGVVFTKALGMALADIPAANVTWTPEGLLHRRSADVAFSVLLPELQVSPVIRNVDKRTLDEVALKVIDLTQRARAKVLDPSELKGASAAILDLGAYGIRAFEPALAPPHSLSLSLGAREVRPVVVNGEIRSAPIITCTLLCDARAVPFAVAAELLATIKALVEEPRGLLLPASGAPLF